MRKKRVSGKCPNCKGTGELRPPASWPPKRIDSIPTYKCTECDGSGKAEKFEMFFWHHDQFPYVLASRGFMRDDGLCYCPSYNACFRPFMSMPLEEGKKEAAWLEELKQEFLSTTKSVKAGFVSRLTARMPRAIKK